MIFDFLNAAFPWIVIGVVVAISCVAMNQESKKK